MNHTPQEKIDLWKKLIADADSSVLSEREWCERNNRTLKQLNYWRHRLEEFSAGKTPAPDNEYIGTEQVSPCKEKGKFVEMSIADDLTEDHYAPEPVKPSLPRPVSRCIDFQSEIRIETSSFSIYVQNGVREETLRMVLKVAANA